MGEFQFDLLTEPWIPCIQLDGTPATLGIRGTLASAHTIREIADPSPLVTASLHRLLLAIVHRVTNGPKDDKDWAALYDHGAFDMVSFDRYFEGNRSCFELFDAAHPFYQRPGLDASYGVPAAKLTHELASGNNATLFDHTMEDRPRAFMPAEAARYLVAQQSYGVGGLVSFAKDEDRGRFGSAEAAPLARGALVLVKGDTLFETLLLNLQRYDRRYDAPFPFDEDEEDAPAWEQAPLMTITVRRPYGYLDLLTWQSRRIRLLPEVDANGGLVVRRVVLMKGNQIDPGFVREEAETMQAFKAVAKPTAGQRPWSPVGFREDRALWRDSLALLESVAGQQERPRNLSWLDQLARWGHIDGAKAVPVDVYGMVTDKAKVLLWRHERLMLPLVYLRDADLRRTLAVELDAAAKGAQALGAATYELAKLLLSPDANDGGRNPAQQDVRRLSDGLAPGRTYWARLEAPFHIMLRSLATEPLPLSGLAPAATSWRTTLQRSAHEAFTAIVNGLDSAPRALKAAARAERMLYGLLRKELGATQQEGDTAA